MLILDCDTYTGPKLQVSRTVSYPYPCLQAATVKMTEVAEHINAMKRKYDTAVHVQELQSLVRGNEVSLVGRVSVAVGEAEREGGEGEEGRVL